MAKKKKSTSNLPTKTSQEDQSILEVFDKAKFEAQLNRHEEVNILFSKATEVLGNYLDDPEAELVSKMLPAKLAIDLYTSQEKFRREDERIEIEKQKLAIERAKLSQLPLPNGSTFNQQNNYLGLSQDQMAELKKKQDELLASFRIKPPTNS